MRLIWVVASHDTPTAMLAKGLAYERTGVDYQVRSANTLEEIPVEHRENPGVVALLDSFHPDYPGFEGLKKLRTLGFTGPIYLFGEPAPEAAIEPFRTSGLSGYFPPFDRADYYFAAGLIHYQLNFTGSVDLALFLGPNGRCASETIRDLKDFNAFGAKLANFVGRFGVDLVQLRKVLMGLSLAHVKTSTGVPTIDQSFVVHYGMDPTKVILAAPGFGKGASPDAILTDFSDALGGNRQLQSSHASMFPEIHHVARAAENLVVLGGSAQSSSNSMDPMLLLTTLTFPSSKAVKTAPVYVFAFGHVKATDEIIEAQAQLPRNEPAFEAAPVDGPTHRSDDFAEAAPEGTIESVDINKILSEPEVTGDVPVQVGGDVNSPDAVIENPNASSGNRDDASGSDGPLDEFSAGTATESAASRRPASELERELARYKDLANHMGQDIKRLMSERREPTTDRELRDANARLQENLKKSLAEKAKIQDEVALRDKQVEVLKQQIEAIRRTKAA